MYEKKWSGDHGETYLRSGTKTSKSSARIEAIGCIDELNSLTGLAAAETNNDDTRDMLVEIQKDLMEIGADLSAFMFEKTRRIGDEKIIELEISIKEIDKKLDALSNFILPGGTKAATIMHVCRTVCRKAERRVVALKEQESVNESVLKYLNRLSEIYFQLARLENKRAGITERIWKG